MIGRKGRFGGFSSEQKAKVMETLKAVEMDSLANEPIGEIVRWPAAAGVHRREALVNQPKILFLDEPVTGIDQGGQEKFLALLLSLKQKFDLTLVMVSHDIRSVVASCDRVACLSRTLHYHDRPQGLSSDVLFKVFQCDLDAVLDTHSGAHDATCCGHDHGAGERGCGHDHTRWPLRRARRHRLGSRRKLPETENDNRLHPGQFFRIPQ